MSDEDEVRALEEQLRQGDLSTEPDTSAVFDKLLADDVVFFPASGKSPGKAAVLRGHRLPNRRIFSSVENTDVEVRDYGNAAGVSCRTDYVIGERTFAIRTFRLWVRREASWKVAFVTMADVPDSSR